MLAAQATFNTLNRNGVPAGLAAEALPPSVP